MARSKSTSSKTPAAPIGFEAKLLLTDNKLRSQTDAAEHHVVLGLLSSHCIPDTFGERHAKLAAGEGSYAGTHPEDKVERQRVDILRRSPGSARNGESGVPTPAPTTVPLARWSLIR